MMVVMDLGLGGLINFADSFLTPTGRKLEIKRRDSLQSASPKRWQGRSSDGSRGVYLHIAATICNKIVELYTEKY
jgi:hypothetical protein